MTANRDADRIVRAWLDLMPDEAPDRVVADVLQAVEATPQVRRPLLGGSRRSQTMNRVVLIAVVAVLGVAIFGVAVFFAGGRPNIPSPTPSAAPTPSASADQASPHPSLAVTPLPANMVGNWIADIGQVAGLGNTDPRIRVVTANDGAAMWLVTNELGNTAMHTIPIGASPGTIRVASDEASVGCNPGDEGTYTTAVSADGTLLTLAATVDACATRAQALSRTWMRAVDQVSKGGLGVVAAFDPVFTIRLPDAAYTGSGTVNAATEVSGNDRTLVAVKDPWGVPKPCEPNAGDKLPVEPTANAFVAYLRTLPGLSVETSLLKIVGHRAVHAAITSSTAIDCATGEVAMWTPKAFTSQEQWTITPGDPNSVYLVEVGGDLILLQWVGQGATEQEERDVLSTITFLDGLPTGP